MARRIREDVQRLVGVVSPVKKQSCPQSLRALALPGQLSEARDREVDVQLHRDTVAGPRGGRQMVDMLERQFPYRVGIREYEPVRLVRCPVGGWFVPRPVLQPQQLSVELGEPSRPRGVEDGVQHLRVLRHGCPSVSGLSAGHPRRCSIMAG